MSQPVCSSLRNLALLAALVSIGGACDDPTRQRVRPRPERFVVVAGPVRLADLLDGAAIDSPLTEIEAVRSLQELGEVPRHVVHAEDFETFDFAAVDWPVGGGCKVAASEGGHALVMRHQLQQKFHGWVVPARPNQHYVFERRARTEAPPDADFFVVEATRERDIHVEHQNPQGQGGASLVIHRPPGLEPTGSWQTGSVSFYTTSQTRVLGIVLRATPRRRADLARGSRSASVETWFDDITLEQVDPTPEQVIAMLKPRALATGADPALGIHKHGQFPPLTDIGTEHRPQDDSFSYRDALYAPPPTDLGFPLRLETRSSLWFSYCLSRETPPGDVARFDLEAHGEDGIETIWSSTLTAGDASEWLWQEACVDLSPFTGKEIELVLRTHAMRGNPHPIWGHPTVDVTPQGEQPRNVILLAVDTLRADRLSSYGYPRKTSPHIDALAADGVRFEHVASNATWTCPSFASIFTGVVPSRHGVWAFAPAVYLSDSFQTLAERFRARGWATNSIAYKPPLYGAGYEQGFDVAFNVPRVQVRADDNLAEALEWLDAHAGRRNFLFLHFDDPHQPYTQPAPFDRTFGDDPTEHGLRLPLPMDDGPQSEPIRELVKGLYDGEVAYVDDRIGVFLHALKERDLYDDAVIIFVSDHGEELWERGSFGHGGGRFHDEVTRVPLIVKPGRGDFARGTVVPTQVRGFDVMPTLLELAGLPVEGDLDAQSLVPLLAAGATDATDAADRLAVTETSHSGAAIRTREWRYILHGARAAAPEVLFHLSEDPGEVNNVATSHPDVLQRMRVQLLDHLLGHRPGRYIVALGSGAANPFRFLVRGVRTVATLFGRRPARGGSGLRFAGQSDGPLLVVAEVEVVGEITGEGISLAGEPSLVRYSAGDLDRLIRAGAEGLYLFEGPPPVVFEPAPTQTIDMQQLEALRALGYVGGVTGDEDAGDGR